ncbi:phosphoribosylaminoimidazolesuccinocarboxamide synthase [Candidatus Gracilibacteria bacterium]|nr:phosphoribosylaminoimidazolesuccinocarboxamide synthase [Candidatus Gracilibacteria bacterium]
MNQQDTIRQALSSTVDTLSFSGHEGHHSGKIRESFVLDDAKRAIVVTDRISAFDFILGTIPFKGQVLNQIAAWWFGKLEGIVPHHFISSPDPNVSVVKNAKVLPVEIIVRGYLTGTTKTSSWYAYQNLDRKICGLEMPAGMVKNQKFEHPIITPTTKPEVGHDEPISREELLARGLVEESVWEKAEEYALTMFAHGQRIAAERGLILVDTKYEMGLDNNGSLMVIDEVHTPDSSRYWKGGKQGQGTRDEGRGTEGFQGNEKDFSSCHPEPATLARPTTAGRLDSGSQSLHKELTPMLGADGEPEGLDKEFVRRMVVGKGYNVDDDTQNPADFLDDSLRVAAAEKYIELFETMTGETFLFPENIRAEERIKATLKNLKRV